MQDAHSRSPRAYDRRPRARRTEARPDRAALWAVVMAVVIVLVAATSARAETGGVSPEGESTSEQTSQQDADAASYSFRRVELGTRTLSLNMRGTDVRILQSIIRFRRIGGPRLNGEYDETTARAVRRFQRYLGLEADGITGPATARALVRRGMLLRRATFYGPGLFGNRTACGPVLRRTTVGVAHRSLPCGTRVTVQHRGRFLETRVIDRGPFVRGISWDLTYAAARLLRMRGTGLVRTAHEPPLRARR